MLNLGERSVCESGGLPVWVLKIEALVPLPWRQRNLIFGVVCFCCVSLEIG